MDQPLNIPYLSRDQLLAEASAFLDETHRSRSLPIPIEQIVEHLGLDIVPSPGLQESFDMVGYTSADMTCIYVDRVVAESRESRYRFTLAHEIAHVRLHTQAFEKLRKDVRTPSEWPAIILGIPDVLYGSMEWQANTFAGLILVPPDSLKQEYDLVVGGIRKMMKDPALKSVPTEQVAEIAWDELVTRLAQPFSVSDDVIQRRLKFDGFRIQDL